MGRLQPAPPSVAGAGKAGCSGHRQGQGLQKQGWGGAEIIQLLWPLTADDRGKDRKGFVSTTLSS